MIDLEREAIDWEDAAEMLSEDIRQPGLDLADLVASAWRARVDPYATRSLVSAACILAGPEVMLRMQDHADPCPNDEALLGSAAEIEADIAAMLRHARKMAEDCEDTGDRAAADYATAVARATTAPQAGGQADPGAARAMQAAGSALADCDAALEILEGVQNRLKQALDSVRQLPSELAGTYESAYDLLRRGGSLPHSGDFLGAA